MLLTTDTLVLSVLCRLAYESVFPLLGNEEWSSGVGHHPLRVPLIVFEEARDSLSLFAAISLSMHFC